VDTKPKLNLIEAALLKVLGAKKFVDMFHQNAEANWISQNQSDLWKSVKKFILLSCYQNFKLTGLFKDSVASTVGYLPFDFRKQEWADKKSFQWKIMPINQDMLPELVEAGEKIGVVSNKASLETGIPEGTPVIASGSDKACEVLGTGCIDEKMANFSYGSLATVNVSSKKYQEALRFHPAYPGVIPGTYNIEMMLQRGFWMISWFKREFGDIERQLAKTKNTSPETLLNQLLESVPAGSDGLMLQPYWSPSNGDGDETRGAIIGFNELHTRAHIYRAMIEGIVYAMRECKEIIEKRTGNKFEKIVISGGGSQSNEIMQISADILGTPVYRSSIFEASSLGAAIASAVGIGIYPNFKVAVSKMVRVGQIFEPNDSNKKLYDQLYNTVFKKMYSSLQPAYVRIKEILK
jgi:sugar (pentulose or hexulose) kinase